VAKVGKPGGSSQGVKNRRKQGRSSCYRGISKGQIRPIKKTLPPQSFGGTASQETSQLEQGIETEMGVVQESYIANVEDSLHNIPGPETDAMES